MGIDEQERIDHARTVMTSKSYWTFYVGTPRFVMLQNSVVMRPTEPVPLGLLNLIIAYRQFPMVRETTFFAFRHIYGHFLFPKIHYSTHFTSPSSFVELNSGLVRPLLLVPFLLQKQMRNVRVLKL